MGRNVPKLWLCLFAGSLLNSCGSPGIPVPPSLELPKAVNDLRGVRKGSKVYLSWTAPTRTTERQTIRHLGPTRICRASNGTIGDCRNPIAELPPQSQGSQQTKSPPQKSGVQASYVDTLTTDLLSKNPGDQISYAVAVLNESSRSAGLSNEVRVPAAPTLPPPSNLNAELTAQGVRVSWGCVSQTVEAAPGISYHIRIYRRASEDQKDVRVGEVAFDCADSSILDQDLKWEESYAYRATIATVLTIAAAKAQAEIEGEDTPPINLFVHDTFAPAVPAGLQAVGSGAGEPPTVDLAWMPNTDADLAGYNLWRRQENAPWSKLNSEVLKTPAFRDENVQSGATYHYSVSAVDVHGNESARSQEASETLP
jgi:hypothetical protein